MSSWASGGKISALPARMRPAHSPRPSISLPETNYPDVRDLTHKLRTAGEFSGFNHTSVLLAPNNPQCLTPPPAPLPDPLLITSQRRLLALGPSPRLARPLPGQRRNQQTWARRIISSWSCHQLEFFLLMSPPFLYGLKKKKRSGSERQAKTFTFKAPPLPPQKTCSSAS